MESQTPKPIIKRDRLTVLARPQAKNEKNIFISLKEVFDLQILEKNPWGQFLLFVEVFVEDHYKKVINRYQEENKNPAKIIGNAINLLNDYHQESWGELLNRIPQSERLDANELYQHISRYRKLTPLEVYQESYATITTLINNAEYGFLDSENRDIGRITQLCDAINYFQNSQSKTYFIISQLQAVVPEEAKLLFAASKALQIIVEAGPIDSLRHFGMDLMKNFRVTRSAIKDEVASNIVLSIGETERELKTQISNLEREKIELEYQLEQTRNKAREASVIEITHLLQNGRQPALDQIQQIIRLLEYQIEETGEAELSAELSLSVFISLRNLMEILQKLGIEAYPKSMKGSFEISQVNLSEYAYIEGQSFTNEQEIKQVECIQQGWRVGETVITPAKVREFIADRE